MTALLRHGIKVTLARRPSNKTSRTSWKYGGPSLTVVTLVRKLVARNGMEADRYRQLSDEARQQAEKAISPDDKRRWLEIAEEWLKLAIVSRGSRRS
jgi:hypothetical protein